MLDRYFRHPVLWDYLVGSAAILLSHWLVAKHHFTIPTAERVYSTVSDLATTSLTLAGFILTLLTVLISFKSSSKVIKGDVQSTDSLFDIFFSSALYFQTVLHLKNAIKSLTLVALLGYLLKMIIGESKFYLLYLFSVFAIVVILLTVWRCITILNQIVRMQEAE